MRWHARQLTIVLLLAVVLASLSVAAPATRARDRRIGGRLEVSEVIRPNSPVREWVHSLAGEKLGETQDLAALVALYESTGGDHWKNRTNWLSKVVHHCDGWHGVTCNHETDRRVVVVDLSANQLSGKIPAATSRLSKLQGLYLPSNQLRGPIPPELGNLSELRALNLAVNQLNGRIPPELGKLANLQGLNLAVNQLSGGLPVELGNLSSLRVLNLSVNPLSGPIRPELGKLSNLRTLSLCGTELSGAIPPELGKLSNLQALHLFADQLSGDIPAELNRLSNLRILHLNHNRLTHLPELDNLTRLQYLYLDHNPWTCFSAAQRSFISGILVHDVNPYSYPVCDKL